MGEVDQAAARRRRRVCRRSVLGAGLCGLIALASAASASAQVFYPSDRYDCYAHQALTGGTVYVDSYQFESGHRYAVGFRRPGGDTGLSKQFGQGVYSVSGKKILSSSGYLTRHHEYLLIETNDLALVKSSGVFQSIGCYDPTKHSVPGGSSSFLGGKSSVAYTCYQTIEYPDGSFGADGYPLDLTFWSDGTYLKQGSFRGSGWKQNGTQIAFTAGPFWGAYSHDLGTWYPSSGVAMPHASGAAAGLTFSLVIRDTVAEGGNPPSVEFSTTDGPNGSSSIPTSFLYCKPS